MPRLASPDPDDLPAILTRTQALAAGLTPDQIRQRLRGGHWESVATGIYRRATGPAFLDPFEAIRLEHRERTVAAALRHPGAVIALESAAILHGLPLVRPTPTRPTLIASGGTRRDDRMTHLHRRALRETDVMEFRPGLWVTTPLRTWIDITRRGRLSDSLSTGDSALRAGLFTAAQAHEVARDVRGRHCRLVRRASGMLDGRRETALESYSFARFAEWDVDLPEMQIDVIGVNGTFIARIDFLWRAQRLIGEADGAWKYQDKRVLYEEKRREDQLRELGYRVIRWGWQDLGTRGDLLGRLNAAMTTQRLRPQAS